MINTMISSSNHLQFGNGQELTNQIVFNLKNLRNNLYKAKGD